MRECDCATFILAKYRVPLKVLCVRRKRSVCKQNQDYWEEREYDKRKKKHLWSNALNSANKISLKIEKKDVV